MIDDRGAVQGMGDGAPDRGIAGDVIAQVESEIREGRAASDLDLDPGAARRR
jgi:hypothetical protein